MREALRREMRAAYAAVRMGRNCPWTRLLAAEGFPPQ